MQMGSSGLILHVMYDKCTKTLTLCFLIMREWKSDFKERGIFSFLGGLIYQSDFKEE